MTELGAGLAHDSDRTRRRLRTGRRVVRIGLGMVSLLIVVFALFAVADQASGDHGRPTWVLMVGLALSVVLAVLTLRIMLVRTGWPLARFRPVLWVSFLLVLAVAAVLDVTTHTLFLASMWWVGCFVAATRRQLAVFAAGLLIVPWARVDNGVLAGHAYPDLYPPQHAAVLLAVLLVFMVLWTAFFAYVNHVWVLLWDITMEATSAREAQARLAVSEERLRFARDMHDLLGHSLSAMAVQSELSARMAERDPQRAAGEMLAVQAAAREALREVRTAVSGYRDVDLDAEIGNVRAVLGASGVECTVTGDAAGLPTGSRAVAAWVVREAATNVLRHSSATRCEITLVPGERALTIEVYNNGVARHGAREKEAGAEAVVRHGNGLNGLAERVSGGGGTLTASRSGTDGFLVRAVLPVADSGAGADADTTAHTDRRPGTAPRGQEREEAAK